MFKKHDISLNYSLIFCLCWYYYQQTLRDFIIFISGTWFPCFCHFIMSFTILTSHFKNKPPGRVAKCFFCIPRRGLWDWLRRDSPRINITQDLNLPLGRALNGVGPQACFKRSALEVGSTELPTASTSVGAKSHPVGGSRRTLEEYGLI